MRLSKQDNIRLLEYVNQYNFDKPIDKKITLDCYVHEIYREDNDTILSCEIINPLVPQGCDESNVAKSSYKIGRIVL